MTDLVKIVNGEALTTSLAIAEGVGNQHKNVMELIRNNLNDFNEFGRVAFQTRPFETCGGLQSREVALLNEPQATLLMTYMRNSEIVREFKKRLVRSFYELAKSKFDPESLSRADILRIAIEAEEERIQLKHEVEVLIPKAEFHDKVAISEDSITVGEAAKTLGTGRNRLFRMLRQKRWVTRKNEPYQSCIESGLMDVKVSEFDHPKQGLKHSITPLVTGKGLIKLQEMRGNLLTSNLNTRSAGN